MSKEVAPATASLQTGALVEREGLLEVLGERLQAAARQGHVALLGGEAGIGKTSVLRALAAQHAANRGTVWWGACDALETPHPLAPLLDIARECAPRFAARLDGPRPALFEAVIDELRGAATPLLLVVEDAHWADDATLDLLKYLGRRIERTHALLAVSFRDDEVGATHPLRRVLGELPPAARSYLPLPRLSAAAVQTLAQRAGRRSEGLHAATQGNAFFVTEMLRDTSVPTPAVPRSVQDLVLARFAGLGAGAQALLRLVAVVPGRTERGLADTLLAPPLADIEAALACGLLLADATSLSYRHELGRVAVESALSAPQAQALHAQVLGALSARQAAGEAVAPARLVHHAVAAHDRAAVSRHAPQAARQAKDRGAQTEAAAHWRIALEHGQPRDEAEHMAWLESFALSGALVGLNELTLAALQQLHALALRRGDIAAAAQALARQATPLVAQLRHAEANAAIDDALALLAPLQPPGAAHAFVWAFASLQRMIERDCEQSIEQGRRAIALASALGDSATLGRAELSTGAALLFVDIDAGRGMLLALRDRQRAAGSLPGVANVLSMIGSGLGELMHLSEADAFLSEAVALAEAHDFNGVYPRAWLALCRMLTGRWDEAAGFASAVVSSEHDSSMSRLVALLALGRLRMRRGDPGADAVLDEALTLASGSGTLQRLAPTACARAEAAFARGDLAQVRREVEGALPLAQAKGHPWFVGELRFWLWRAGVGRDTGSGTGAGAGAGAPPTDGCAGPWALSMSGQWQAAAQAWAALGCPYEQARALADGDGEAQRQALAIFEQLGAAPAAEALRRRLRDAGERGVARGARASTQDHPAGLTRAEQQVLALLAQDLRNAEIAARIHRSVRTVDHHVAAVLAKLGVDSRQAAVQHARRAGWVGPGDGAI